MAVCCAIAHRGDNQTRSSRRVLLAVAVRRRKHCFTTGARRWLPSFLRSAIFPFNLADSDHIMTVPDFSSFLFHDHMFGVSGKGEDRFMVLPIDNCDSGPVGISRWLNAQIALVALSKLDHPLI